MATKLTVEQPIDAVIGINYVCNSRCIMCNIWKNKDEPELSLELLRKLPSSLRDVNISGGETFLRKDIPEVVAAVTEACPDARIVISTNGFTPALIEKQMKKILEINPDIGVAISIDGVGEMHETIRRIPDGYNKCIDTLERLQALGMTNLRFGFTIIPENVTHFSKVYEDAMKRGIEFTHSFAQTSENYFGDIKVMNDPDQRVLKQEYRKIIRGELKSWNLKKWARAFYSYSLYVFIMEKKQKLDNAPGTKFFFIGSDGTVFPSVVHNFPMGNLNDEGTFEELWQSDKANAARDLVRTKGQAAWMICTARTAIRKHPFRVGAWIFRNKFFGVNLPD